jgi:hypothetical protein
LNGRGLSSSELLDADELCQSAIFDVMMVMCTVPVPPQYFRINPSWLLVPQDTKEKLRKEQKTEK